MSTMLVEQLGASAGRRQGGDGESGQGGFGVLEVERPTLNCAEMSPDGSYGRFVVEPLERGYGLTLGNSLRRILLSSIAGAAVTSIKIDGVLHEFSALPGVVEDVVEIVLNVKGLAIRMDTDEARLLRVDRTEEGPVTAADIMLPQDVEIVNPDHLLATLDRGGRLRMEMTVEKGRGYVPAERNKKAGQPIGVIPVDSIFTPVRRVNYTVENTRVGQITNYDRLIMEVWTNGAVRSDEALREAAQVLIGHLQLFAGADDGLASRLDGSRQVSEQDRLLATSIEALNLSVRSFNCLKRAGINTIGDLVEKTPEEMMKVRNLGQKSLEEVQERLAALGLGLRPSEEE